MFFGRLLVQLAPEAASADGDLAVDIAGLRYMVFPGEQLDEKAADTLMAELHRLAAQGAEITITAGQFTQDVSMPAEPFPGGGMFISEFFPGRLFYDAGRGLWRQPDGAYFAADLDLAGTR
jgi:hypothetical protein